MKSLFQSHLNTQLEYVYQLLEKTGAKSFIFDSGMPDYYFHDDQTVFFRPNPHFLHYCPDSHPGHILQIQSRQKPKLFYFQPDDFWHEVGSFGDAFWVDSFDIQIINREDLLWSSLDTSGGPHYYLSPNPKSLDEKNLQPMPNEIISALNWARISKSEYEIQCIREANKIASLGHKAAEASFRSGKTERETFQDYMVAAGVLESQLPYSNIVAFNEKSAILHYQNTRATGKGETFLIDAGAKFNGYCSDITRTYFLDSVHSVFKEWHRALNESQLRLCSMVAPEVDYRDIQEQAHMDISQILCDTKVIQNTSAEDAFEMNLTDPFFPHGVGHALGIQVHDVGGKQIDEQGTPSSADKKYPFLRTLRNIQPNDVLTIEPGIYVIPLLLENLKKDSEKSKYINWGLLDELEKFGGIRIEDNVVASTEGPVNLTRPFLA